MTGYAFHPEARLDLDEIWEFIRTDNLDAADRVIAEILSAIAALAPLPGYSGTRVDVSRNRNTKVDATPRERRPCIELKSTQELWFRSRGTDARTSPHGLCASFWCVNI